jgi:hypothetical protein
MRSSSSTDPASSRSLLPERRSTRRIEMARRRPARGALLDASGHGPCRLAPWIAETGCPRSASTAAWASPTSIAQSASASALITARWTTPSPSRVKEDEITVHDARLPAPLGRRTQPQAPLEGLSSVHPSAMAGSSQPGSACLTGRRSGRGSRRRRQLTAARSSIQRSSRLPSRAISSGSRKVFASRAAP